MTHLKGTFDMELRNHSRPLFGSKRKSQNCCCYECEQYPVTTTTIPTMFMYKVNSKMLIMLSIIYIS